MAKEAFIIEIPVSVTDNTGPGLDSATQKVTAFDKAQEKMQKHLDKFNRSRWKVALEATDRATNVISRIGTNVRNLTGRVWRITMSVVDRATAPIRGIFGFVNRFLKNPIVQAGAVLGVSFGFKDVINTYGSFESVMSKVKALSKPTEKQFEQLNAKAKELGATTKYTATEVGEAMSYMGMAGWKTDDMLGGISGILSLAAASGEDLAKTSDIVTDALTAFGLKAGDATHFADVLAVASSSANTNVGMMGETFKYVGAASGALGYSIEDVALGIGLMANSGIKSSQAGTELNSIFTRLSTNSNGARDAIEKLGIKFYKSNGSARSWGEVLEDIRKKTANMTKEEKINFANKVAGQRAQAGLLAMLNASQEDYDKLAESIKNADGAAAEMAATMLDNMEGSFTLLQSAVDGVKNSLGERLSPYMRSFADWLTGKMPAVETAIGHAMDFVDEKISWLKDTIHDFTSGEDWANADIWGKLKIAWGKIIQEPFSEWWTSTGETWLSGKLEDIGKFFGKGISELLLAALGIDVSAVLSKGRETGSAFIDGFKQGFDTEEITKALKRWASENKGVVAAIGAVVGFNLITGIAGRLHTLTQFIKRLTGSGSGRDSGNSVTHCTTATVKGNIVNVYGKIVHNPGNTAGKAAQAAEQLATSEFTRQVVPSLLGRFAGSVAAKMLTSGGPFMLGGNVFGTPALGGSVAAGSAKGLTSIGSWLSKLLGLGSTSSVIGADGTVLTMSGGLGGTLGSIGAFFGGSAETAAGAAAVGGASIAGILGTVIGSIGAIVDIVQGYNKGKGGDAKGAKDEYVTAGTKAGMMATGAAIGAAIGSIIPGAGTAVGALVGGGIGGAVSLFTGDKAGKAISDSTDEGGFLNDAWKATKKFFEEDVATFFTKTIPDGWHSFWDGVGSFFTNSVPSWWNSLKEKVSEFFEDTIVKKWNEFWKNIEIQLTVVLPYVLGYTVGKLEMFFTETLPDAVGNLMDSIGSFLSDVYIWASDIWNEHIVPFFTETLPEALKDLWTEIGLFFTSTLPTWASDMWTNHIVPFFTVDLPDFFDNFWGNLDVFFTSTLPTWAANVWNSHIVPFFTISLPAFFSNFWSNISTFFNSTLPTWASNLWNNQIVPFFTTTLPGFFAKIWASVGVMFAAALPVIAGNIWSAIHSWFTSLTSWLSTVWSRVTASFGAGYGDATGKSGSKHAWGGIMNAPHMAMVAENGPEAIIPLSKGRNQRGIDLWEKAGQILGVQPQNDVSSRFDEHISPQFSLVSSRHAWGGILNAPHMALVAEDGPEAIIPLSKGRNQRGIDLWEKAGQILGVQPENDVPSRFDEHISPQFSLVSSRHAWGGIMNAPHMALVAENGPEAIIPLSKGRNQRGIDLWTQTGRALGMNPYSDNFSDDHSDGSTAVAAVSTNTTGSNTGTNAENHFDIKVEINPQFIIDIQNSGMDEDGIVATIKAHIREMVDDISDELAEKLARVFSNMPIKGEVA